MLSSRKRIRQASCVIIAAALVGFLAIGCQTPVEKVSGKPATDSESPPEEGGRLVLRLEAGLNTLNPVLRATSYELEVLGFLYDGLVELDRNLIV